ncbi:ABC transporter substrate-binding protein [Candidatus Bipolaricaulota bacterium]|nr:ABC transporter substrate-binding protein [Candidatus Bipolaricaulota bacterium]HHR84751.1 ABC transporter substrate-binding protein [Candidatus Acetothermia bacterium]
MKRVLVIVMLGLLVFSGLVLAQEKTKVVFWHAMSGTREALIQRMVDNFNLTHPGIEVVAEYKGSYRDTLNAAQAAAVAGNAPNVLHSFEVGTQQLLDMGIFALAQDVIDQYGVVIPWQDYLEPALNYYKIGGVQASFPWNSSNSILYYNKTLLDKAGVTMPREPTFEDIVAISRAVINAGVAEGGITWPMHSWFFEQWMAELGANLLNNDNGRSGYATEINLLDPAAVTIMNWWKQLYDEGLWINPGRESWSQARQNFTTQRVAMMISSTSDVNLTQNAAFDGGWEVGTAFMPVPLGFDRHGVVIGGGSLWLTKGHSDAEMKAAAEFVVYMSQVAQDITWHQSTGYFALRKTSLQALDLEGWYKLHPNYKTASDQLAESQISTATQGALSGVFPDIRTYIEDAAEEVYGGASVTDALTKAKGLIDQALVDYKELMGG